MRRWLPEPRAARAQCQITGTALTPVLGSMPLSAGSVDQNLRALRSQLTDLEAQFNHITSTDLPAVNKTLGDHPLTVPSPTARNDAVQSGGIPSERMDPDALTGLQFPRNLRLWN